jgi:hypothetical protein
MSCTLIYNLDDILLLIFQLKFYILCIWALLHIQLEVGNCIAVDNINNWQSRFRWLPVEVAMFIVPFLYTMICVWFVHIKIICFDSTNTYYLILIIFHTIIVLLNLVYSIITVLLPVATHGHDPSSSLIVGSLWNLTYWRQQGLRGRGGVPRHPSTPRRTIDHGPRADGSHPALPDLRTCLPQSRPPPCLPSRFSRSPSPTVSPPLRTRADERGASHRVALPLTCPCLPRLLAPYPGGVACAVGSDGCDRCHPSSLLRAALHDVASTF